MTHATPLARDRDRGAVAGPPAPRGGFNASAFAAAFRMAAARQLQARRLLALGLLFALPAAFALLGRYFNPDYDGPGGEFALVHNLIPQALAPLAALVFASGMIRDEIDDQTLTYLMIRPIPRWAVYAAKLLATFAVTAGLTALFTGATYAAIYAGRPDADGPEVARRALVASGILTLALAAYCSLFGAISLVLRRALVLGVTYIVLFEGVLANIDFLVRKLTVMFYVKVLGVRWLGLEPSDWSIDLDAAPSAATCVLTLLSASAVLAAAAALAFGSMEFRVKTPDGG